MAANRPISVSAPASCSGELASPARISEQPMPKKNASIMPRRLQRSPSQPAGSEKAPKAIMPPIE